MSRVRRSVLYMPGDSMRKIHKAAQMAVDSIVMDLEDSVALNHKHEARRTVSEALRTVDFGRSERLIRLNPPPISPEEHGQVADLCLADLDATIDAHADGYVIPKVETHEQLLRVTGYLDRAEDARGWPPASIRLLAIVETARGIMNLKEIAQASREQAQGIEQINNGLDQIDNVTQANTASAEESAAAAEELSSQAGELKSMVNKMSRPR